MATEQNLLTVTRNAGVDLSGSQYRFVQNSGGVNSILPSAAGDAEGVIQNNPSLNDAATVAIGGTTKLVAGGAIPAGSKLTTAADGRAVVAGAGNRVLAQHVEAGAAVAGQIFTAMLLLQGEPNA